MQKLSDTVRGKTRNINRTITAREDGRGFSSRVDDGVRGYSSGHNTIEEARASVDRQTDTLLICQLWDTIPGLQFQGHLSWEIALEEFWAEQERLVVLG